MGRFGERLRREREMRGITLDQISAVTKISTRLLRALEDEQFDLLPGGIFNKGYVRGYAKYVGIDEEQAVADYLEAANQTSADVRGTAEPNLSGRLEKTRFREPGDARRAAFPIMPVLILVGVIAAVGGGWHLYRERQRDREQRAAQVAQRASMPVDSNSSAPGSNSAPVRADPALPPQTQPASSAVGAPGSTPPQQQPANKSAPLSAEAATSGPPASFEVTVRAKDRAWVSVKSDGKILVRGVIQPPEVKTIHAANEVVFWTGNAGQVEVAFNGKNVPLTGGANDEQVLVFNSRGLEPQHPAGQ